MEPNTVSVEATMAFPRIVAFETPMAAWYRIEHSDGRPGVDGVTLDE